MDINNMPLGQEPEKKKHKGRDTVLTILFLLSLIGVGFVAGYFTTKITRTAQSADSKLNEIYQYLDKYWLYADDYEDLKTEVYNNAYYGMTSFEDDPYTSFMSVSDSEDFSSSLNKQQYGVGVGYHYINNTFIIDCVYKDSGAENAGIQKGDILISVNGEDVSGLTSDELKEKILGVEGTYVNIGVLRNDEELSFDVERKSYNSSAYAYLQDDTVILTISSFGDDTPSLIASYLQNYTDKEKLVIDLRNNPGGYLGSLQSLTGLFIGNNVLCMQTENKDGKITKYYSQTNVTYDNFNDIVIMINGNTASAAEVFTICLKECLDYVTVIGETSYGKGVMQTTYRMSDGDYIKITTAKWYSPSGVSIHKEGIEPDIEVYQDDVFSVTFYEMEENENIEIDTVSIYTECVQLGLKFLGYEIDRTDGYMSSNSLNTIKQYQIDNGLAITDSLNYETYNSLFNKVYYTYYSDSTKDLVLNKALELVK